MSATDIRTLYRIYTPLDSEFDKDGYPAAWQVIKNLVREQAGNRCVRCGHPYMVGEHKGSQGWSRCGGDCTHEGPFRVGYRNESGEMVWVPFDVRLEAAEGGTIMRKLGRTPTVEARWRILTVHHLNGVKADCRWWNLVPLCQQCHLRIQGIVDLERAHILEHTEWFKVYAAGWYAVKYEMRDVTRAEAVARMDELLAYERLT